MRPRARVGLLLLALLAAPLAGCATPPATPPSAPPPPPPPPTAPPTGPLDNATILAWARTFNGSRAFDEVRAQVERDGKPLYRVPGTEGNNATAATIAGWMRELGWSVAYDNFTANYEGQPLPGHNVVASRAGTANRTLYVIAHYDSRPCADEDPDPSLRTQPVLGANDGGSGVAVMVELARALGQGPTNLSLVWLFDDAEDMGDSGHGCGTNTTWAQGAQHFADALTTQDVARAKGLVLLDLVGGDDLQLRRETFSARGASLLLQNAIWSWAAKLGRDPPFFDEVSVPIEDDHVPFLQRGMPAVDVIHLDNEGRDVFPDTHHTTHDDLSHMSAASLQAVGEAVLAAILQWDAEAGTAGSAGTVT